MIKNSIDPDGIPKWLERQWSRNNYTDVIAGINDDDCAVIRLNENEKIVLTTDFLNANPISVELGICDTSDLGRLLVASNISDLCGTGANPIAFLLGVTMAKDDNEDDLFNFFEGVKTELDKIGIPLVGGDTKLGKSRAFIGTAIGNSNQDRKLFLKNEAKPDDILWVSGELGAVGASVYYYANSFKNNNIKNAAKKVILSSDVPINKSKLVSIAKIGNGGTDISDGLGADLYNLLDASNVGAEIYSDKIPYSKLVDSIAKFELIEPWMFSLIIGGDFQFMVTTKEEHRDRMKNFGFIEIGRITKNKEKNLIYNDKKFKLPDFGHRDGRKQDFRNEVKYILKELNNLIY